MKEFYTVGEVSKIFGVPASTLRFYDDIGLLSPWKTGENGYRYYSKAQFEIISMICFMRSLGTPVKRLKTLLSQSDPGVIRAELSRNERDIEDRIEELRILKQKVSLYRDVIGKSCFDDSITIEKLPDMYMMSKPFGAEDELDIDEILNATRGSHKWAETAGIISTVSVKDLKAGNFHVYERYGFISELPYPAENKYTRVLKSGKYVCGNMVIRSVEHYEADEAYKRMLRFIKEQGLLIKGPAIERNVLDIFGDDPYNPTMYFTVYIPVR
ncbi:MAG: MerR family transcriptional regulator [Lachnospiraceae bacterium]|nr:MerR family transcriptional regulator [Lachnospiraceae bacterium]